MKNLNIKFGGFYGSLHEDLIDMMLDNYFTNSDGDIEDYSDLDIDYKFIFNEYVKEYIAILAEFICDELEINIKFHNLRLDSPRFYNYSTDEINCNIANSAEKKLINKFKKDVNFTKFLTDATISRSGFISFYTFSEAYENKDGILIQYIFDYICRELLSDEEYMSYYDIKNVYELIYNIDFIKDEAA